MAKGLITDRAFVPVQCSMQAVPLHEEQLRQALTGSVQLDATTQLHGHPIRKGYVFWQEDITELVALLEELRLTQEELHDIGGHHTGGNSPEGTIAEAERAEPAV